MIEQAQQPFHFQKLFAEPFRKRRVPRFEIGQPDADLLQELVGLGEALAQLSDLLLRPVQIASARFRVPARRDSARPGSGVEFFPEFAPDSFELREELISLDLLPFEQLIDMGVGFLQFLDASVPPVDLRGRAH